MEQILIQFIPKIVSLFSHVLLFLLYFVSQQYLLYIHVIKL